MEVFFVYGCTFQLPTFIMKKALPTERNEIMTIVAYLSDNNTATIERDSLGLRIVSSGYHWIDPPKGKAYYLDESCLQGGPIAVREYVADETGKATGQGQLVTSGRSILRYRVI
jgi:hypothetical protein